MKLIVLLIHQKAIPNNSYKLNNLPGHGRIDIIFRCMLNALRTISKNDFVEVDFYSFLKGGEPKGYLHLTRDSFNFDQEFEVSLARKVKENWETLWHEESLINLAGNLKKNNPNMIWMDLQETGFKLTQENIAELLKDNDLGIVLGSKNDITPEDRLNLEELGCVPISIHEESLLASQVIGLIRLRLEAEFQRKDSL